MDDNNRTETYRFYIANSLYYAARNQGLAKTLDEILYPKPKVDGNVIVADILKGAELVLKE